MGTNANLQQIEIRHPTPADLSHPRMLICVTKLINDVYAEAEQGLWKPGLVRTNTGEVLEWCRNRELYLAFHGAGAGALQQELIGSIRIRTLALGLMDFDVLTMAPSYRSYGLGRWLVDFAESLNVSRGSVIIQLVLLVPSLPRR